MAGGAAAPHVDHQPQRVVGVDPGPPDDPFVEHVEALDPSDRLAELGEVVDRLGEELLAVDDCMAAGGVERDAQQAAGTGRLDQRHRPVHHALVDPGVLPEVEDRGLGEAPDDLVRRGKHEVGPALERRGGQPGGEVNVRPPRLVHEQGDARGVGEVGERGDVGDRAEVGRGGDHHGDRVGVSLQRGLERLGCGAVRDPQFVVHLGRDEMRLQAPEDHPVDRRGVRVPLDDDALPHVCEREADGMVAARPAVHEEPGSLGAPGLRRELLGLLEVVVLDIADVDAGDARGYVHLHARAGRSPRSGPDRPRAALVARDGETAGVALAIARERV